jgi:hypothetical protein
MLDMYGFPGPVTPQVPQNRVRQTYRGLPDGAPGPFGCGDCKLPPNGMGALPAGAFMGAIGVMLAGTHHRYTTPGTLTPEIAATAGLDKGGGGGHHHHHHRGGRGGGGWWGYPGGDTYIVQEAAPCPYGWVWDPVNLKCVKIPTVVLRGLGSTATDWCTALRTGAASAAAFQNLCDQITDATAKAVCQASFRAAQAAVSTGCAHVDDPSGGTLPPAVYANSADRFVAQMNEAPAASQPYFQPAQPTKSFTETTSGKVVIGVGAVAVVGLLALALLR